MKEKEELQLKEMLSQTIGEKPEVLVLAKQLDLVFVSAVQLEK